MAELEKDVLKNGVTVVSNPVENTKTYIDKNDRSVLDEAILQLRPLEKALRNALKRDGMAADDMNFYSVVTAFYNRYALQPNEKPLPVNYLSDHPARNTKLSDFEKVDNLNIAEVAGKVVGALPKIVTGVKSVAANVRNKAKAKKAQKIADAGGYNTLSAFQKSLIADPNLVNSTLSASEQSLAVDIDKAVSELEKKEAGETSVTESKLKKIIIIVVSVVAVILVAWFFLKKK